MRRVIQINHIEKRSKKSDGSIYYRTHVLLDDGTEAVYWGRDIEVNTSVMVAFHKGMIKAIKPKT